MHSLFATLEIYRQDKISHHKHVAHRWRCSNAAQLY